MIRSPERLARVLAREVGVGGLHAALAEQRAGQLGQRLRERDERLPSGGAGAVEP